MASWWRNNRDKFWSVPTLICDGKVCTTYLMVDDRMPKEGKPNLEVELRNRHTVNGYTHDPMVAWPHLMPEFASRAHLWTTLDARSFTFEPLPDDGPEGSVRVVVHREQDEVAPVRGRYWCEPTYGFCIVQKTEPVFRNDGGSREVAYTSTEMFEDFRQSPRGFWYPRRNRRTTSRSNATQVREYYVDFQASMANSLFVPLELDE